MAHKKFPLSPARWDYLKSLRVSEPRYLHIACKARMIPDPSFKGDVAVAPLIPFVAIGTSYNVGRNKAKREKRDAAKAVRA